MSVYSSSEIRNSAALEAEAEFGLCCIEQFCMTLRADSSILEVGSGPGLLLSNLQKNFPELKFEGIEPHTSGYQGTKNKSYTGKTPIHNTHYEQFEAENKFDLVFSINVFEHLRDWKDFINKAAIWLKPDGLFVVLCPNYSFPYESHYGLPIFFNKETTFRLFKKQIEKFDAENNTKGLWDTLNFVKKREIMGFVRNHDSFDYEDMLSIVGTMVDRVNSDDEFRSRHPFLANCCALFVHLNLFYFAKFFRNYIPYMQIVLKKR